MALEKQGTFIVIEGSDGSGKSTQFRLLSERLRAIGHDVEVFKFPQYDQPSSHFIKKYLNGEYGPASNISPYTASLFYALDRYEAAPHIREALEKGKVVLADRYVGSNMAHQGSKFTNPVQQRGFFIWADSLEFQLLNIPRPTLSIYLRVPAEISYNLISSNERKRDYTAKSHDEHEKDIEHLSKSVSTYDTLCQLFPKDFAAIESTKNGKLLSIPEINNRIWKLVQPLLPPKVPHRPHEVVLSLKEQAQSETKEYDKNSEQISDIGTNETLGIELDKISLLAVSGMEFLPGVKVDIQKIYWSEANGYDFYVSAKLGSNLTNTYKDKLGKIAKLHAQMSSSPVIKNAKSASGILDGSIPLAALAKVRISASSRAIQNLIKHLEANSLEEARWAAKQLHMKARKEKPALFGPTTSVKEKDSLGKELESTVLSGLSSNLAASTELVSLKEFWPRNEFDLLADIIYPYSNLSRDDIKQEIEKWPYIQKHKVLKTALDMGNSNILEQTRYKWDVIDDRLDLKKFLKINRVGALQTQAPSPRYGYKVPDFVEVAGLDELYLACFDESLALYSHLQENKQGEYASYTTLLGHRTRWQFVTNAEVLEKNEGFELERVIREKINEVHPIIGGSLSTKYSLVPKDNSPDEKTKPKTKKRKPSIKRSRKPKK